MTIKKTVLKNLIGGLVLVLAPSFIWAQQRTITGRVTSLATNEALSGVTVQVAGTARGTATDDAGRYTISAASGETLQFSAVGYHESEIKIAETSVINVQLQPVARNWKA